MGRGFDSFTFILGLFDITTGAREFPMLNGINLAIHLGATDPSPISSSGTWQSILGSLPLAGTSFPFAQGGGVGPAGAPSPGAGKVPGGKLLVWDESRAYVLGYDYTDQLSLVGFELTGLVQARVKDWSPPSGPCQARRLQHVGSVAAAGPGQGAASWGVPWKQAI